MIFKVVVIDDVHNGTCRYPYVNDNGLQ